MKAAIERFLLVAVCAAVGWFYVWTVRSSGDPWKFGLEQRDYYNLLIDGWLDGQLHMKVEVPEALLKLKDPYDPAVRPVGLGLHDASFYRGKYYVYFGMAPVVVLMLPFRLWTGIDLPLPVAALVFTYGGFLASVGLFLAVRRRCFPAAGMALVVASVFVLGLAGLGPVLLRRPHMWEMPIGAGYCFAMLSLWCLWQGLQASRAGGIERRALRRAWWLAGAALALGLAIGSRPTYLLASPLLAVPLVGWWIKERRVPWRAALGVAAPLAIVGGAMAWHNYARFGHPLQFGQAYQFSLDYEAKMAHFRLTHVPFNVWRYFFSAAEWSRYFPFIQPAALPPKPPGFGGHDDVYGLLVNLPVAWLALAAPLAIWRRDQTERRALALWLVAVAVLFATMAGTLLLFFGSLARYQSDFAPALMLLATVGILALERWWQERPGWWPGGPCRVALAGLALFSAAFAVLYSLQLDSLLRERNPAEYRRVARRGNWVAAAWERWRGLQYGALELTVPAGLTTPGRRELLFTVGDGPAQDRVYLTAEATGAIRLEVEAVGGVKQSTKPLSVAAGGRPKLRITMGSLLPPGEHPLLAGMSDSETAAFTSRLRLEADGQLWEDVTPWFAAPPGQVTLGPVWAGVPPADQPRRDPSVLAQLRTEAIARAREATDQLTPWGALNLQVSLPGNRTGAREPLLATGRPGRGDLVAIEYGEKTQVFFLLDHWGGALQRSGPVEVDFSRPLEIRIAMDSLRAPSRFRRDRVVVNGQLEIAVNGRRVWRQEAVFFVVSPVEIAVGRNAIGGTTCGPQFTGVLRRVEAAPR